jgi:hypothetical protein
MQPLRANPEDVKRKAERSGHTLPPPLSTKTEGNAIGGMMAPEESVTCPKTLPFEAKAAGIWLALQP